MYQTEAVCRNLVLITVVYCKLFHSYRKLSMPMLRKQVTLNCFFCDCDHYKDSGNRWVNSKSLTSFKFWGPVLNVDKRLGDDPNG
ncbi:unnamed protein product [Larinioides sclopetarius]|uniref:Uncharacterized protein n=1 Tax=Larinioides sclopetarius TaxID=280406 RepID=A0AAV1ZB51_9ARAC